MLTPADLKSALPLPAKAAQTVFQARDDIRSIFARRDHRLLVIVGPCSIHDPSAALEYGERLAQLRSELGEHLLLVMRTYFEKPRSTVGWRGLIDDPELDGSCDINAGIRSARELLLRLNEIGVPCATESLDPLLVGYTDDLVAWTALGARTAESQIHRAMASNLPMPVGIKNATSGDVDIALDAIETARSAQAVLGTDEHGRIAVRRSPGNQSAHVVLRGGKSGPNFHASAVHETQAKLSARALAQNIIVDCSHANSNKQAQRQLAVLHDIASQIGEGNSSIVGVMIESHLFSGRQDLSNDPSAIRYGVSITDECLGWDTSASALRQLHEQVASMLVQRQGAASVDKSAQVA
jgi:3-deoxy-7-phosphoheptulonate synthase